MNSCFGVTSAPGSNPHLCFHWFPLGFVEVLLCGLLLVPYEGGTKADALSPQGAGSYNSLETIHSAKQQPCDWGCLNIPVAPAGVRCCCPSPAVSGMAVEPFAGRGTVIFCAQCKHGNLGEGTFSKCLLVITLEQRTLGSSPQTCLCACPPVSHRLLHPASDQWPR